MSKKVISPVDELFVKLPYAVLMDESLTPADKIVYASLRIWARIEEGRFEIFPSIPTIAKNCCLSERQVRKSIHKLAIDNEKTKPLISIRYRRIGNRSYTSVITLLRLSCRYNIDNIQVYSARGGEKNAPPGEKNAPEVDVSGVDDIGNDSFDCPRSQKSARSDSELSHAELFNANHEISITNGNCSFDGELPW